MDLVDLLTPIADYLNFLVDFLSFNGMDPFLRLGTISPVLITYLFIGSFIGIGIKHVNWDGQNKSNYGAQNNSGIELFSFHFYSDFLKYLQISFGIAFAFFISVLTFNLFNPAVYENVKDLINAILAFYSVFIPFVSLFSTIIDKKQENEGMNERLKKGIWIFIIVLFIIFLFILFLIYLPFSLSKTNGIPNRDIWWITAIYFFYSVSLIYLYQKIFGLVSSDNNDSETQDEENKVAGEDI